MPQSHSSHEQWLDWVLRLQAIAQTGLTYAQDPFDIERYQAVREIAAEMMSGQSNADFKQVLELFNGDEGHATPKVDVRGVVFQEDRLLLVRERSDDLWTLPGGWVDPGETPSEAIVREIREESGFETRAVKALAIFDHRFHGHPPYAYHVYKLFFQCELIGGSPTTSYETTEVAFFDEATLPKLSLIRVTPSQLKRFFEHHRHPNLPTDFD